MERREKEGSERFWGNTDRTWPWVGCGVLKEAEGVKESGNSRLGRVQ